MTRLLRGILTLGLLVALGAVISGRFDPHTEILAAAEQDANVAVQSAIQRSNDEQVQAIANHDSSLMADTVTPEHYQELVKINQDLLDNGVSSINLVRLDWGAVAVNGSSATATTYETWRTVFTDGTSNQSRDRNDYALVLDNGTWKIQSDDHPDASTPPSAITPPQIQPFPIPDNQNTSHNWSGYAATGGSYSEVSGTWNVPQFAADGPSGIDAAWVGIGGVRSRDLIQAGTQQTVSGSGRTQYQAWIEMLPRASRPVPLAVHPGDSISVDIAEQSTDHWLIHFSNNTTGQTYDTTQVYTSSHSSAEWVEEAPSAGGRGGGGILPLDNFGTIQFSAGSAVKNGQTVTIADTGARAITMLGNNDQPLAVPSALGSDGASFSVARTDAPATAPGQGRRGLSGIPFPVLPSLPGGD
jgi:peptidase A4-like protein